MSTEFVPLPDPDPLTAAQQTVLSALSHAHFLAAAACDPDADQESVAIPACELCKSIVRVDLDGPDGSLKHLLRCSGDGPVEVGPVNSPCAHEAAFRLAHTVYLAVVEATDDEPTNGDPARPRHTIALRRWGDEEADLGDEIARLRQLLDGDRYGPYVEALIEQGSRLDSLVRREHSRCRTAGDRLQEGAADVQNPMRDPNRSTEEKMAQAIGLLAIHPDWSNKQIAEAVGINPSLLSRRQSRFRAAREAIKRAGARDLRRSDRSSNDDPDDSR